MNFGKDKLSKLTTDCAKHKLKKLKTELEKSNSQTQSHADMSTTLKRNTPKRLNNNPNCSFKTG